MVMVARLGLISTSDMVVSAFFELCATFYQLSSDKVFLSMPARIFPSSRKYLQETHTFRHSVLNNDLVRVHYNLPRMANFMRSSMNGVEVSMSRLVCKTDA